MMDATQQAPEATARERLMHILRQFRMAAGLSQTRLAKRLKLKSQSTVSMWESGQNMPSPELIPPLSRLLGIPRMTLVKAIAEASDERPAVESAAK